MKKLFKILGVVTVLATRPLDTPRRFNVFTSRVQITGSGRPALDQLTVRELRKLATSMKIKGRSKARRKADLVKLIKSKRGIL